MKRILIAIFAVVGILDSAYLTYEHYNDRIVLCIPGSWFDCGKVLDSEYSILFGVPLALWGLMHYTALFLVSFLAENRRSFILRSVLILQAGVGFVMSLYFIYLQLWIIQAICQYCMVSAINSIILFVVALWVYPDTFQYWKLRFIGIMYRIVGKPLFFAMDPYHVHVKTMQIGELLGSYRVTRWLTRIMFFYHHRSLEQEIAGIRFPRPVGLSAGYDYEARLTQILPEIGFGFMTVGTITNQPFEGNPPPMLGRLPQSKSLLVNKGFRNPGADAIISRLTGKIFRIPVGVSIGVTNSPKLDTMQKAIDDITEAFSKFEQSPVAHSYYELNISCPNLSNPVSFYETKNLENLLNKLDALKLKRPVFIKMPIEKSDDEVMAMMKVISRHQVAGVIFGNLQKDRKDKSFIPSEVSVWNGKKGNFSGKPTWKRSNELISLVSKQYGKDLTVIGCGGTFSAEDAQEKRHRGASLVQLITGMIFIGPQLISQIHLSLVSHRSS
ncbi:MAG: vitamin K epoxide reductase family protein [Patescibacteria group bacterium]